MKSWLVKLYSFIKMRGKSYGCRLSPSSLVKGNVTIGKNSYVGGYAEIRGVGSAVKIGNYCSIARGVKIMSSGQHHDYKGISTYPFYLIDKTLNRAEFTRDKGDVTIGHDVWIGVDAIIMPGVSIGNGAVIGAGAIVTKDIGAFEIAVGMPAKVVKKRFSDELCVAIQNTQWWLKDYRELKPFMQLFIDTPHQSEAEFQKSLERLVG
jgi:virginiamycin A acetyltransferase